MNKKRIAILLPVLWGGGAERVASILSQYLDKKGYSVYIFTYSINKAKDYSFLGKIIKIENRPITVLEEDKKKSRVRTLQYELQQILRLLTMQKKVRDLKKKYKIDISISFMEEFNLINILSRVNDQVLIRVCTILSEREIEMKGNFYYNKNLLHFLYNRANKVIVMTKYCKNDLVKHYGIQTSKIKIIKNPVLSKDNKIENHSTLKKEWYYGDYVVISLGRIHEIKQQQHLIRSFKVLQSKIAEAKLLLVGMGMGEHTHYLKKLVNALDLKESVIFTGQQQNVDYYLKNSKVFVLTSKTEGFPNSMLEAMVHGVPVVAVDCPGAPREILAPNTHYSGKLTNIEYAEYGVLVPALDGQKYQANDSLTHAEIKLEEAMEMLLCNESLNQQYRIKAGEEMKKYATDRIGHQWEKSFER